MAIGYSGAGDDKNSTSCEDVPNKGPIPRGLYTIQGPPTDTADHGPFVLRLVPEDTNVMYGRSGFLVHGDSIQNPGCASEGCIIMPRFAREAMWNSPDHLLQVIAAYV
jgi:hypothetical protein